MMLTISLPTNAEKIVGNFEHQISMYAIFFCSSSIDANQVPKVFFISCRHIEIKTCDCYLNVLIVFNKSEIKMDEFRIRSSQ